MKKSVFAFLLMSAIAVLCYSAESSFTYELTQNDVSDFLSFVDDYVTMAAKFIPDAGTKSIPDIVFSDNKKLLSSTENYLKTANKKLKLKSKWDYTKLINFITTVTISLDAINYYEEWGYPEETGADDVMESEDDETEVDTSSLDPYIEIPKVVLDIAQKNKATLEKYFPSMNNMMDDMNIEGLDSDEPADTVTPDTMDDNSSEADIENDDAVPLDDMEDIDMEE
ncbi:MAG: hypothetical protein JW969_17635 [Spirochaetales bacterium]|nr:hypothetical protein [Spirochaetales bacterium]